MKAVIITIVIFLLVLSGIFLFIIFNDKLPSSNKNTNAADSPPSLPADLEIPASNIDLSNFENANRVIKKEELMGKWQLEYEDSIGEKFYPEGIFLIFTEDNYEKNTDGEIIQARYTLENNQLTFTDNVKVFVNIKNNKLILVYPEYPKAEVYKKIE